MAVAAYTTDLQDLDLAQSTTNWTNVGTGALASETDFYVQNANCVSKPGWTGDATRGAIFNSGSGKTITTPNVYLAWIYFWGPGALETEANGGHQLIIGSGTGAYKQWYVRGSDTISPYEGWVCVPVDPSLTADATTGSPTSTLQYFGALARIKAGAAIGKGNPFGIDAIRYGRAELRINGGDLANGYATFAAAESTANSTTNRWGLFQSIPGGYQWQGLLTLGYTSAVDFRDSNRNIVVANTKKVVSTFNKIEVRQATSRVDWTAVSITSLGTVSRGSFECIDDADINWDACTFTDFGTFIFKSASTVLNSTFRRCGQITTGGAILTNCTFDSCRDAATISATSTTNITKCKFISDGSNHAVDLGTVSSTTSMDWDNTLTGYATSNGSTGNEAIKVNVASGQTLTINVASGATSPTYYNTGSGTVTLVSGTVTAKLTVTNVSGTAISGAQVMVKAVAGGNLPADVTVTISNSGTTATVTHTGHGMLTGDKVLIKFASDTGKVAANEGVFAITKINDNSYSYTMGSSPGSSPTGTIKATYVLLNGTTNGSGEISVSRSFAANQPVIGWARKSTSAPYYKQGSVAGTVTTGGGASLSAVLIADE